MLDWCDVACGGEESCGTHCLWAVGQDPAHEYTCGTWDGGPTNDHCDGNGCETECSWYSTEAQVCWFENEESTCGDYGVAGRCGDNACISAQGESCENCEVDCSTCVPAPCGNYVCDPGESYLNCPSDCEEPSGGYCGDDTCDPDEDGDSCPEDCMLLGANWCNSTHPCPTGWDCEDHACVWGTNPLYVTCNPAVGAAITCPVGQSCRYLSGAGNVCLPTFTSGSMLIR